jgi:hypothetical protein
MASSLGRMTQSGLCPLYGTRELRHPPIPENYVTGLFSCEWHRWPTCLLPTFSVTDLYNLTMTSLTSITENDTTGIYNLKNDVTGLSLPWEWHQADPFTWEWRHWPLTWEWRHWPTYLRMTSLSSVPENDVTGLRTWEWRHWPQVPENDVTGRFRSSTDPVADETRTQQEYQQHLWS